MKHGIKLALLMLIPLSSMAMDNTTFWRCSTTDGNNRTWHASNFYQKMALNHAFDACKKESETPLSCKTSLQDCEGFNQGLSTRPRWRCTALDYDALPWQSNAYSQRLDAALAAKAYCKSNSAIPDSCYINLITCRNMTEH
ncbi:MAG: hypothetical protein ACRC0B_00585 [Legionella sp.]